MSNSEIIHLSGNVILKQVIPSNGQGKPLHLNAEQLTIETEKNIAHSRSKIKLSKGQNYIQATGMRADLNKNRIEFLSNTRSHYVLPAE
jgi:LPS export ABC transporter protein LptC